MTPLNGAPSMVTVPVTPPRGGVSPLPHPASPKARAEVSHPNRNTQDIRGPLGIDQLRQAMSEIPRTMGSRPHSATTEASFREPGSEVSTDSRVNCRHSLSQI